MEEFLMEKTRHVRALLRTKHVFEDDLAWLIGPVWEGRGGTGGTGNMGVASGGSEDLFAWYSEEGKGFDVKVRETKEVYCRVWLVMHCKIIYVCLFVCFTGIPFLYSYIGCMWCFFFSFLLKIRIVPSSSQFLQKPKPPWDRRTHSKDPASSDHSKRREKSENIPDENPHLTPLYGQLCPVSLSRTLILPDNSLGNKSRHLLHDVPHCITHLFNCHDDKYYGLVNSKTGH